MSGLRTLVVVRHAHRDLLDRSADNGLSAKGWEQARSIADFLFARLRAVNSERIELLSSPRLRCQETLEALGAALSSPVEIEPLLNEASSDSERQMEERIERFMLKIHKSPKTVLVICSHGDWIPAFLRKALGESVALKKGAFAILQPAEGDHPFRLLEVR